MFNQCTFLCDKRKLLPIRVQGFVLIARTATNTRLIDIIIYLDLLIVIYLLVYFEAGDEFFVAGAGQARLLAITLTSPLHPFHGFLVLVDFPASSLLTVLLIIIFFEVSQQDGQEEIEKDEVHEDEHDRVEGESD